MDNLFAKEIIKIFGNGNFKRGLRLLILLAGCLVRAREMYPGENYTRKQGQKAFLQEVDEFVTAFETNDKREIFRELLDVVIVGIRALGNEYAATETNEK